jgi:hypothetical protein
MAQLPQVLEPWLDTPAGLRQFVQQSSTYLDEAHTILGTAGERTYPAGK